MYYYEKDYIMRLIHGIARALAGMFFGREAEEDGELTAAMGEAAGEVNDYLRRMVDNGQINAAEDRLFELIGAAAWSDRQKSALVISFYDYVNSRDDAFLARADFSREEIFSGLRDAMRMISGDMLQGLFG